MRNVTFRTNPTQRCARVTRQAPTRATQPCMRQLRPATHPPLCRWGLGVATSSSPPPPSTADASAAAADASAPWRRRMLCTHRGRERGLGVRTRAWAGAQCGRAPYFQACQPPPCCHVPCPERMCDDALHHRVAPRPAQPARGGCPYSSTCAASIRHGHARPPPMPPFHVRLKGSMRWLETSYPGYDLNAHLGPPAASCAHCSPQRGRRLELPAVDDAGQQQAGQRRGLRRQLHHRARQDVGGGAHARRRQACTRVMVGWVVGCMGLERQVGCMYTLRHRPWTI